MLEMFQFGLQTILAKPGFQIYGLISVVASNKCKFFCLTLLQYKSKSGHRGNRRTD